MTHFGDPCIHCGLAHDAVESGPCAGDKSKAIPVAWCSLGVRWDHVEHYKILMSTGEIEHRWEHIEMHLPFTYLKNATFRQELAK